MAFGITLCCFCFVRGFVFRPVLLLLGERRIVFISFSFFPACALEELLGTCREGCF
jgi:hypothetical protein